jgi:hypothetical protein
MTSRSTPLPAQALTIAPAAQVRAQVGFEELTIDPSGTMRIRAGGRTLLEQRVMCRSTPEFESPTQSLLRILAQERLAPSPATLPAPK